MDGRPGQDFAGIHLADRAHVIDAIGMAGAQHRDLIHVFGDIRQPVGNPKAALAVLFERVARGIKTVVRGAKSALQCFGMIGRRHRLPGIFHQRGLGIEQIDMAGRAFHEAPDDGLGARRDLRFLGSQRINGSGAVSILIQHGGERDGGQAAAGLGKKLPPIGHVPMMLELV